MVRLLIVDDERNIRQNLAAFFGSLGYGVSAAADAVEALQLFREAPFDIVLTDYRMAEMNGLGLLREIKRSCPTTVVILMTAYATVENAVDAMKAGAYDYVTKPFSLVQIQHVIERAAELSHLQAENRTLRIIAEDAPMLESRNAAMIRLLTIARQAASSDATILLEGESGTGKNVLARQIHNWSRRHQQAYVVVNCTTLSDQLLESELFGHVRGAFTGAIRDKRGRLEAAHGGTVFLDEIADLSPTLQAKFLRFVQEQSFERVGGERTLTVDARIIAASNRDLAVEVRERRFREDLYYRLNVVTLRVPPLRERREDILPLARWLLQSACIRNRRPRLDLSAQASAILQSYNWPGNIRELRNVLERAAVLCRGEVINASDLPDSVFRETSPAAVTVTQTASLEEIEREHIARVLRESATLEEAAATLGINVTTLWRKRRRYKMD